jgi:hypothetical protein
MMDREGNEVVELGAASVETQGSDIVVFEGLGYAKHLPGISDD